MIAAHPLQWPVGWPRTPAHRRKSANFSKGERLSVAASSYMRKRDLTVTDGVDRVLAELRRMRIRPADIVISTNVRTRLDGLPRSGERKPDDPGAAVYWQTLIDKRPLVMAVDRYDDVADNLAAIALTLESMRAIERHGGAQIIERAFTGFTALPAAKTWRDVLGIPADGGLSREMIDSHFRRLASEAHPDKGGSHERMTELNRARDEAFRECGA